MPIRHSCSRLLLRGLGLLLAGTAAPVWGASPSQQEFETAVDGSKAEARSLGWALRTDGLWMAMLKSRTPMMAAVTAGTCHIGYSPYAPGRDYGWLFPDLEPTDRGVWLAALVRHELAHCLDGETDTGTGSERWREAYADLAFALHVDANASRPDELIRRLVSLRQAHAATDPAHDTAAVLLCYLAHPERRTRSAVALSWPAQLSLWRARCPPP